MGGGLSDKRMMKEPEGRGLKEHFKNKICILKKKNYVASQNWHLIF